MSDLAINHTEIFQTKPRISGRTRYLVLRIPEWVVRNPTQINQGGWDAEEGNSISEDGKYELGDTKPFDLWRKHLPRAMFSDYHNGPQRGLLYAIMWDTKLSYILVRIVAKYFCLFCLWVFCCCMMDGLRRTICSFCFNLMLEYSDLWASLVTQLL